MSHQPNCYCYPILSKTGISLQILEQLPRLHSTVSYDAMPCCTTKIYQHLTGRDYVNLQATMKTGGCSIPHKTSYVSTRIHGITSQNTVFLTVHKLRTSKFHTSSTKFYGHPFNSRVLTSEKNETHTDSRNMYILATFRCKYATRSN